MSSDLKLFVKRSEVIGGLRLDFIAELMDEAEVSRAYVAGYIVRRRGGEYIVKPASPAALKDFIGRLWRRERVLIVDHASIADRLDDGFRAAFRIGEQPLYVDIDNLLEDTPDPELFPPDKDPDFDDINRLLHFGYLAFVGSFRPVAKKKAYKKLLLGRGDYEFIYPIAKQLPVPEPIALFIASGFLLPDGSTVFSKLSKEEAARVVGIEFIRWFHRFGPAFSAQITQPGYGKTTFYKTLRVYDTVAVFDRPPGKAILYSDERYRPPAPGAIFVNDLVVFDEVGERKSKHVETSGVADIWPAVKAQTEYSSAVARVAILGNVVDVRGKPIVQPWSLVRDAISDVLRRVGVRQVEGRADRLTLALTAYSGSLHGKRSRSEYVLDPSYYRLLKKRYDIIYMEPRLFTYRFDIALRWLQQLSISLDEHTLLAALNPLQLASDEQIRVEDHMKAIEELGSSLLEVLESFDSEEVSTESRVETNKEHEEAEHSSEAIEEPKEAKNSGYNVVYHKNLVRIVFDEQ